MKTIFKSFILLLTTLNCATHDEDDGSAAQQPCYFAISNACESTDPIVTFNGKNYVMSATATYPATYTGDSLRGDCPVPEVSKLPKEKLEYFTCSPQNENTPNPQIDEDVEELRCPVVSGGEFVLTINDLSMKAYYDGNEATLKCNGVGPSRRSSL